MHFQLALAAQLESLCIFQPERHRLLSVEVVENIDSGPEVLSSDYRNGKIGFYKELLEGDQLGLSEGYARCSGRGLSPGAHHRELPPGDVVGSDQGQRGLTLLIGQ